MGITNVFLPHLKYLWIFFAMSTLLSFASGSLDAGGNVLILDCWQDKDAGPYMHSIHFSFALGAFMAPLLAVPFLGNNSRKMLDENVTYIEGKNVTLMEDTNGNPTKIPILYPIIGFAVILVSIGYFIAGCLLKSNASKSNVAHEEKPQKAKYDGKTWTLLILISLFFFFYVGAEVSYGTFILTFAVKCDLKLSKTIGAEITSIFWGSFAFMRFASIFTALYLRPVHMMFLSFGLSLVGAVILVIFANESVLSLQIGSVCLGLGMASIYATGLLWLESYVKITNRIGAAMSVASGIGADVFPVIIGQYLTTYPMILMYVTSGTILLCSVMFLCAIWIAQKVNVPKLSVSDPSAEQMELMT